jgi:hypothetical protein
LRNRVADQKVVRLVRQLLAAGVLAGGSIPSNGSRHSSGRDHMALARQYCAQRNRRAIRTMGPSSQQDSGTSHQRRYGSSSRSV